MQGPKSDSIEKEKSVILEREGPNLVHKGRNIALDRNMGDRAKGTDKGSGRWITEMVGVC